MNIDDLSAVVAVLLAVSLATERWVALVKTLFPALETEPLAETGADRPRRLAVQGIAIGGAWVIAAFVAGGGELTLASLVGLVNAGDLELPVPIVGLLASGGSAFWAQVLQLTGVIRQAAAARGASEALRLRARAERMGLPLDEALAGQRRHAAGRSHRARTTLQAQAPERLQPAHDSLS